MVQFNERKLLPIVPNKVKESGKTIYIRLLNSTIG
jgi:hypothetical protein